MTKCKAFYRVLSNLAETLDSSRLSAVGGAQRQGFDQLGSVAGYNGDGATMAAYQDPGIPNMVTEYSNHDGPAAYPWRAGKCRWVGYGYGTLTGNIHGLGGVCDYYRLPGEEWYQYRQENLGTSYTLPVAGTAAKLILTADTLTIGNDGTDDCELTAQVANASGTPIDNTPVITLTATGGGLFPTGPSMTFNNATTPDTRCIRYGMAKMTMRSYTPGTITVTATSAGLPGASVTITCIDKNGQTSIINYQRPQSPNTNTKQESYKVMGGKFTIPREFRGRKNAVTVYDISGKLLQKSFVKGNCISTHIDRESAKGVFIVKVNSK
jgi:beta-galactosidase